MGVNAAPLVLAHRGASGYAEENTLAAFEAARRLGADGVELDVHLTADGVPVVHHDRSIPGLGEIGLQSAALVTKTMLPRGGSVPTLEEALATLRGLEVWVELKTLPPAGDATLLGLLSREDPSLIAVHSFDHRLVRRLTRARPGLRAGILSASYPIDPVGPMAAAGAMYLWQQWESIDSELVEIVHRKGGKVVAWTVPHPEAARALAAMGVDALCGNYPDQLRTG